MSASHSVCGEMYASVFIEDIPGSIFSHYVMVHLKKYVKRTWMDVK